MITDGFLEKTKGFPITNWLNDESETGITQVLDEIYAATTSWSIYSYRDTCCLETHEGDSDMPYACATHSEKYAFANSKECNISSCIWPATSLKL